MLWKKTTLVAFAVLGLSSGAAMAQSQFAGGYGGVTLGYGFGGDDKVGVKGPGISGTYDTGDLEIEGTMWGAQAGYRWEGQYTLLGVELGLNGGDLSDSFSNSDGSAETELNYEVSLRGSIGWESPDDVLFYGFFGVGRAEFDYKVKGPEDADIDDTFMASGILTGLGAEWALNEEWSLRAEYRYSSYGKEELKKDGYETKATPKFQAISIGANYRF